MKRHTPQTLYRWQEKCAGLSLAEAKRLKALEVENAKLIDGLLHTEPNHQN